MELMPYQTWLLTALFLTILLYLTFYTRHRQREELQEMLLLQQQMYIGSLEELQKEVRMYRHDYENVNSGMMLRAKEGDTDGSVTLIFSRQEECLAILVGNTIRQEVDVRKIFQEGYSSKGKDRGLGLASLERILKKYRNVASMTRVHGREFVQELKIS